MLVSVVTDYAYCRRQATVSVLRMSLLMGRRGCIVTMGTGTIVAWPWDEMLTRLASLLASTSVLQLLLGVSQQAP